MIFTSNYAIAGRHPDAVATSQGIPGWFKGRVYRELAPHRWMIKLEQARFTGLYREKILAPLKVDEVLAALGNNAILLCWEAPSVFCHRMLAAEWIEREAGIVVREWVRPQVPEAGGLAANGRRGAARRVRSPKTSPGDAVQ